MGEDCYCAGTLWWGLGGECALVVGWMDCAEMFLWLLWVAAASRVVECGSSLWWSTLLWFLFANAERGPRASSPPYQHALSGPRCGAATSLEAALEQRSRYSWIQDNVS